MSHVIYNKDRFNPSMVSEYDHVNDTLMAKSYLNYKNPSYEENAWMWQTILDHLTGAAGRGSNVDRHIITEIDGEGSEFFQHRRADSGVLYPALFSHHTNELVNKTMGRVAAMEAADVVEEERGIIGTSPGTKNFYDRAGGKYDSFKDQQRRTTLDLTAFGETIDAIFPTVYMEDTSDILEQIRWIKMSPIQLLNWSHDWKWAVTYEVMTHYSDSPMDEPRVFVQYIQWFTDRYEWWKLMKQGKKWVEVLESPYPHMEPVQYYFPDRRELTDANGIPRIPIFKTTMGINSHYFYTMAARNSYLFDCLSRQYYSSMGIVQRRMKYDHRDPFGNVSGKDAQLLKQAMMHNAQILPGKDIEHIKPNHEAYKTYDESIKQMLKDYKADFNLNLEDRAVQKTVIQSAQEGKNTDAFITLLLDKLGDCLTQVYEVIVDYEKPGDEAMKQKVHVKYPSDWNPVMDGNEPEEEIKDNINTNTRNDNNKTKEVDVKQT